MIMKRFSIFCISALLAAGSFSASAWDLKEALKGLGGDKSSTAESIAGALGNMLSTDKLEVGQLKGDWKYSGPAVTFASDNFLKKAGGAAASTVITNKLESVYNKIGLNNMTISIDEAGAYVMKVKGVTLKGTITPLEKEGSQANFEFSIQVASRNVTKMNAYIEKNITGGLKMTFDVSKLITLLQTVSKIAGNSTLKTLSSTLSSYDGLCAGFELKK